MAKGNHRNDTDIVVSMRRLWGALRRFGTSPITKQPGVLVALWWDWESSDLPIPTSTDASSANLPRPPSIASRTNQTMIHPQSATMCFSRPGRGARIGDNMPRYSLDPAARRSTTPSGVFQKMHAPARDRRVHRVHTLVAMTLGRTAVLALRGAKTPFLDTQRHIGHPVDLGGPAQSARSSPLTTTTASTTIQTINRHLGDGAL